VKNKNQIKEFTVAGTVYDRPPVTPDPVVDPMSPASEPETDRTPRSKIELNVACHQIVSALPEDLVPSFYDEILKLRSKYSCVTDDVVEKPAAKGKSNTTFGGIQMSENKNDKQKLLENKLRPIIRQMLIEMHAEGSLTQADDEPKTRRKWGSKLGSVNVGQGTDIETHASFEDIAKELGYSSVSGAKSAVDKAVRKLRFLHKMHQRDPEKFDELVLTALDDYIDYLVSSGELNDEDMTFIKTNPQAMDAFMDSPDFRDFMHKHVLKAGFDPSGLKPEKKDD
jgi:hypothetical protein